MAMDLRDNKVYTPVESGFPITAMTIDLTKRCNLACDYCFAHCFSDYEGVDLTPEMGRKIIDWAMDPKTNGGAKKLDISFWGGEPLLRWNLLKELVLYAEGRAKELGGMELQFGGTTNITLLTPDKFDFLDEHNIHFLLSVDGTKEHHDRHRKFKNGMGSHDIIDKNLDLIMERWPYSQLRFSYSVENLDGFMEDIEYMYGKGCRDIVYSPVSEGDWNEERIAKLYEVWDTCAQWFIDKHKEDSPVKMKFIEDACMHINGLPRGDSSPCGAGRGYVGITVDGAIYPCHRFNKFDDARPWYEREVCLGHIEHGILNQQWRERFVNWSADKDLPESCKDCKAFKVSCTGGCWATNWDICGALEKVPRSNCEAALATLLQAEKVSRELPGLIQNIVGGRQEAGFPEVQGCECYNVHDNVFGRKTVNSQDPRKCLCNMSTYGVQPKRVEACTCYNIENNARGAVTGKFDTSGASCKNFQARPNPLPEAIRYMKDVVSKLDKLTQAETQQLDEFMELKELADAKQEELDALKNMKEVLEKTT